MPRALRRATSPAFGRGQLRVPVLMRQHEGPSAAEPSRAIGLTRLTVKPTASGNPLLETDGRNGRTVPAVQER